MAIKRKIETPLPETTAEGKRVKFIGGRSGHVPLSAFTVGPEVITLPEHGDEPFVCEHADDLVRIFGHLYKRVR